ncbi:hypothetical protein ACWD4K_14465 [Streptomyces gelaticus]
MDRTKLCTESLLICSLSGYPLAVCGQECVQPAVQALLMVFHVEPESAGRL